MIDALLNKELTIWNLFTVRGFNVRSWFEMWFFSISSGNLAKLINPNKTGSHCGIAFTPLSQLDSLRKTHHGKWKGLTRIVDSPCTHGTRPWRRQFEDKEDFLFLSRFASPWLWGVMTFDAKSFSLCIQCPLGQPAAAKKADSPPRKFLWRMVLALFARETSSLFPSEHVVPARASSPERRLNV